MKKLAALIVVTLILSACYRHTIHVGNGGLTQNGPSYEKWEFFWLTGLIGKSSTTVNSICPSGNATVEIEASCIDSLVTGFCGGLLSPRTIKVYCGPSGHALNAQEVRWLVDNTDLKERIAAKRAPQY